MAQAYKFREIMYARYAPYYDAYKGHEFVVDHSRPSDGEHVWLTCITGDVKVDGMAHLGDLEPVD